MAKSVSGSYHCYFFILKSRNRRLREVVVLAVRVTHYYFNVTDIYRFHKFLLYLFLSLLISVVFLVHSQVEIFRLKYLRDLFYEILAYLIVYWCGKHSRIVLQPHVMARREVKLWNKLKAHSLQLFDLCFHGRSVPRALDSDLGVRFISKSLAYIDYQSIDSRILQLLHMRIPALSVKEKNRGRARSGAMLSAGGISFLVPHVRSEMNESRPHKIAIRLFCFTDSRFSYLPP